MNKGYSIVGLSIMALLAFQCKEGSKPVDDLPTEVKQVVMPKSMSYSIVASYPHDTASFTEGLLVYKGTLYESTGNYGKSKLRKLNLKTGKVEKEISLDAPFFGEGATIINDTVYQLTWKERKAFAYSLADFKKIKEYAVTYPEGWGLTNDGKHLIVSTGGSDLIYYEPGTFKYVKTVTVTEAGNPSFNINELEYIDGFIYANQWNMPYIFKIDPGTGVIVAKADVTDAWNRAKKLNPTADVPNGIAYDATTKKIYITGKWWPELYEVQFGQ
jgi:glutaminyl-peptide cyclotransferase